MGWGAATQAPKERTCGCSLYFLQVKVHENPGGHPLGLQRRVHVSLELLQPSCHQEEREGKAEESRSDTEKVKVTKRD